MDDAGVAALIALIAKPANSVEKNTELACHAACEALKQTVQNSRDHIIDLANHEPLLQSCSSDGTPILVSKALSEKLPGGYTVRRRGKESIEFLVACEFTRHIALDGTVSTSLVFLGSHGCLLCLSNINCAFICLFCFYSLLVL